jgi:hypothetical protein
MCEITSSPNGLNFYFLITYTKASSIYLLIYSEIIKCICGWWWEMRGHKHAGAQTRDAGTFQLGTGVSLSSFQSHTFVLTGFHKLHNSQSQAQLREEKG